MTHHFPFHDQKPVETISEEQIEAFNLERFRFAQHVPGPFEAVREAAVKLLESAMGARKGEATMVSDVVLQRYTGTSDDTIW